MPKYQIFVDNEGGNEAEDSTSFISNKEFESGFGGGSGGNVDDISNLWDQAVQDVSGGSGQGTTTGNSPYSSQGSSSREGISQSGNTQHSSSSGSELRFGSLTSQPNTSKKPQRTSFTGGGSGGNGGSGWEDSKVVTFVVNSRAYIFVNENQYMFAIWCMILIQICLLVFMCQHLSFINAVQSKFFPDGTFKSPDSVDVKRNLDLEENVKVSRETFFSVLDMCHTFMCFEKANSDFSSECLCFSEVQRQWDMAKGMCENKLSGVDGKLAVFDTESKQQSLESILREYFSHRPTDDSYSYYSGSVPIGCKSHVTLMKSLLNSGLISFET
ncbi:uncharacterized protein LOC142353051 [Convolutriloba macropyga]|uniref:uncharacterized protein LOC142353051 n=1 Tax=Convolutriloba macropyga TaxID=536237 RepID=UPI003F51C359